MIVVTPEKTKEEIRQEAIEALSPAIINESKVWVNVFYPKEQGVFEGRLYCIGRVDDEALQPLITEGARDPVKERAAEKKQKKYGVVKPHLKECPRCLYSFQPRSKRRRSAKTVCPHCHNPI